MPQKQEAKRTVVSAQDVLNALAEAHVHYFGCTPSPTTLLVLLAQSAGETAWWGSMWNNNLGNYKALVNNDKVDWFFLKCWEMLRPDQVGSAMRADSRVYVDPVPSPAGLLKVWFSPDHPACAFMSFPTLADGAREYLTRLVERFSSPNDKGPTDAWYWATKGDLARFIYALRAHAYFTADPEQYLKLTKATMAKLQTMGLAFPSPPSDPPMPIIHPDVIAEPGTDE